MVAIAPNFVNELRRICGEDGVIADPEQLLVYECDAFTLEKKVPDVVVLPRTVEQAVSVVRLCADREVPIIPRGTGTGLSGAVLAVSGSVVVATTRLQRILDIDFRNRRALVEAGVINAWITNAVKHRGLMFAPDPSSQPACTIGGNIAFNAGGPHTLKHGVTSNHVLGFEMVLSDGEAVWLGARPDGGEDVGGYDLRGVTMGAEGMFGLITRVMVRLVKAPRSYRTMLGIFNATEDAGQAVSDIIAAGILPGALEMMDQPIIRAVEEANQFGLPTDAKALLIVELEGHGPGLDRQMERVIEICRKRQAREIRPAANDQQRLDLWKCRKRAFGAMGRISANFITQDGVVPRTKLPEALRYVYEVSRENGLHVGNVFHAGDGNLHPLIFYDERIPGQAQKAMDVSNAILARCVELGGSITGEHGIGVEKIASMPKQFTDDDLDALQRVRRAFDPVMLFNPGKIFPDGKRVRVQPTA